MSNTSRQITRLRLFEHYLNYLWPAQRRLVKKHLAKRCSRCILSERYSPLVKGLCAECRKANSTIASPGTEAGNLLSSQLESVLREHQRTGSNDYDALLMLSGGKDSALLLYRLLRDFPELRILTLSIDNGFFSPVAKENVEYLVRKLDVDHIAHLPAASLFQKTFSYALTHLDSRGCYDVVDRLDGDLLHDIGRHMAAQLRIPLLLSGVSKAQIERIFEIHSFEMPREREHSPRTESGGFSLSDIYSEKEMAHWWNPKRYPPESVPRFILPFYAWNYDEADIKRQVKDLELIKPGNDSPLITNNATIPVMGLVDMWRLGYSSFEPEFAQLVRQGQADRKAWLYMFELLEYSAKTGFLIEKDVLSTLTQLGLSKEQVLA